LLGQSLATSYAGANRIRFDGTLSAFTRTRAGTPDELPEMIGGRHGRR